jgi:putative acetyltransferase
VSIAIEPAHQPDVQRLLDAGGVFARSLYAEDECFLLDLSELEQPGVTVWVARINDEAIGMVALVSASDGSAEIKRLFVHDSARGSGVASGLLTAVEEYARHAEVRVIRLETGPRSDAALALYSKHGYQHIPLFGQYIGSGSSVCMEKVL